MPLTDEVKMSLLTAHTSLPAHSHPSPAAQPLASLLLQPWCGSVPTCVGVHGGDWGLLSELDDDGALVVADGQPATPHTTQA